MAERLASDPTFYGSNLVLMHVEKWRETYFVCRRKLGRNFSKLAQISRLAQVSIENFPDDAADTPEVLILGGGP